MMRAGSASLLVTLMVGLAVASAGDPPVRKSDAAPPLSDHDRVRVGEAFQLAAAVEERVWPGWGATPFDLVLVEESFEYLVHSEQRPEGFEALGSDALLGGPALARKRTFAPNLLATFPAFGGAPTIVVGTPKATGKSSTAWIVTVLHEHFHQHQYSAPGYYDEVDSLGLSGGDKSGMWMLDYPFPYASAEIDTEFSSLSRELARLLVSAAPATPRMSEGFWARYERFSESLKPEDYRYLSFQLWQEGIARYVELKVAEVGGTSFKPSSAFAALPDFEPLGGVASRLREEILQSLREGSLKTQKRVAFYAFGAALGLLLDQEGASWKERYLREKFYLERYRKGVKT